MALSKDEINFYNDQGYLLVEDVISENQHKEMLALVDGFFEKSKMIRENDNIFDLEDGHSSDNPRLKRIKQPHQHSQFFWDIIKKSKIEEILKDGSTCIVQYNPGSLNDKIAKDGKIGFRIPNHDYLKSVLTKYQKPITTTSINATGSVPLYIPDEIEEKFGDKIDLLIDDGIIQNNPSKIFMFEANEAKEIR